MTNVNEKSINIYMIRHGISETNALQKTGIMGWIKHLFVRDPCLVKDGINDSQNKGQWIKKIQNLRKTENIKYNKASYKFIDSTSCNCLPDKFEFVMSSELMRAIETAACMFNEKKIYVVPYVSEIQGYKNIVPKSIKTQQNFISTKYPRSNVDWSNIKKKSKPNYKKFKKFLEDFLESKFSNKEFQEYYKNKSEINVALVTHSLYMMKNVISPSVSNYNCCFMWRFNTKKPKNNSIFKLTI